MKKFLEMLGLPTTNDRGHELGCMCDACREARRRADTEPFKPGTLGRLLQDAADERRGKLH